MRALVAFDKFKDSLPADAACAAAAQALQTKHPEWHLDVCPITDGGDGFARILTESAHGTWSNSRVLGPRGRIIPAGYGMVPWGHLPPAAQQLLALPNQLPDHAPVAIIEMAQASGLALLKDEDRDPWRTNTVGTGQLIHHASEAGAQAVLLGVGGSATNDLGLGALSALGLRLPSASGARVVPPIPADWSKITRIEGHVDPKLPPIRIACDVANPLLGPEGAVAVYGRQKGLQPEDQPRLEAECARLAKLLCAHVHQPETLMTRPGAGAAGGIAFGLMTAARAQLLPGADLVTAWLDLENRLAAADLLITGEGGFDASSLSGKGPGALAQRALALGKPVHVFAGRVSPPSHLPAHLHLHAITPQGMPLNEALIAAPHLLGQAVLTTF